MEGDCLVEGRSAQLVWYVALLIINTIGILEIVYILLIAPRTPEA